MSNNSKVCACQSCAGPQCTCGCQNPNVTRREASRRAGCQCGEACACGTECRCGAK